MPEQTTSSLIEAAVDRLRIARFAISQVAGPGSRPEVAARNVAEFGSAAVQLVRALATTEAPEPFDAWFAPVAGSILGDPIVQLFDTLRQPARATSSWPDPPVDTGCGLDVEQMQRIASSASPPGAKGMFVGLKGAGGGFEILTSDGQTSRYFVELPELEADGAVRPEAHVLMSGNPSAELTLTLAEIYVAMLEALVESARRQFA